MKKLLGFIGIIVIVAVTLFILNNDKTNHDFNSNKESISFVDNEEKKFGESLSEFEYEYTSKNDTIGNNQNAKDGSTIKLGNDGYSIEYKEGISLITNSEGKALIKYKIDKLMEYTSFETDYGIDKADTSATSATFKFFVDGILVEENTVNKGDFHSKFIYKLDDKDHELLIEIYALENTCVSFGNPVFYRSSNMAITKYISNIEYLGFWKVPLQKNANLYGNTLKIGSMEYSDGLCINSTASFDINIDNEYSIFEAYVGIDEGVAGGSNSGSVNLNFTVYDEDNNVLRVSQTPVLYGYMEAYKIIVDVEGGAYIRVKVEDGGDGISNDMCVIGTPIFTNQMSSGFIYASDLTPLQVNVGEGTFIKDKTVYNEDFNYQIDSDSISFEKGIGLYLVDSTYQDYKENQSDRTKYSYVKYDISKIKPDSFEAIAINKFSNGVYYEIWIDNSCVYESGLIKGINASSETYPVRISTLIPEGAKELEIRAIAESSSVNGQIDFVNPLLLKSGKCLTTNYIVKDEKIVSNYPLTRNVMYNGSLCDMQYGDETRKVYNAVSSLTDHKYTFNIEGLNVDSLKTSLGLYKKNSNLKIKGIITVEYLDGSQKKFETKEISKVNSGNELSIVFGDNAKSISLEAISLENDNEGYIIWANPLLYKNNLMNIENVVDLNITDSKNGWGSYTVNKSLYGGQLTIGNEKFTNGFSLHAFYDIKDEAYVEFSVPASYGYKIFECLIGVNKDTLNGGTSGSVIFKIYGDGEVIYESSLMRVSDEARHIILDVSNISTIRLAINNGDNSYDCDCADYINPTITTDASLLNSYLDIISPIPNETDVMTDENKYEISGIALGKSNDVDIYLNNEFYKTIKSDECGNYSESISFNKTGNNTITVKSNGLEKTTVVLIAKKIEGVNSYDIKTNKIKMNIEPASNGMIVNSVMNTGNVELLSKKSFIPFISTILLGGCDGEATNLEWKYVDYIYYEEPVKVTNINSRGDTYDSSRCFHVFKFVEEKVNLELRSIWFYEKEFNSPIQHKIEIDNKSGNKVKVTNADSMNLSLKYDKKLSISYSYKSPMYTSNYGYRCDYVTDDYDMNVFSTTDYNNGMQIDAGYIPWISLNYQEGNYGIYMGLVWSDCRLNVTHISNGVFVKSGFRDSFYTEIKNNDTFYIPSTFIGYFDGDVDDGSNDLKEWFFTFMMPECNRIDDNLPNFEFNLWEVLDTERRSWRMDDSKFYKAVDQLYELGIDEITIDTYWWKNIGDWRGVHEKWQSSIEYSSNYVNKHGMDFSLYLQAGNGSSLDEDALSATGVHGNPDWFARGINQFWTEVCLGDEDAREYLLSYLKNYYMELNLNGMRTDFGWILGYCDKKDHDHVDDRADVGYWTSLYMYEILKSMYEYFPVPTDINSGSEVNYFKWENCNCGGTLKDFASMSYATRIQTTDAYDAVQVRRSFYDTSYCFPSMQLMLWMNDYMYNGDGPFKDKYRFYSLLMGAPCPMISLPSDMDKESYDTLKRTIEIYDNWMKALVKYGRVYHNMDRCDGVNWDGIEYYDSYTGHGAVLAFKPDPDGSVKDTENILFKGLNVNSSYYVWSENNTIPFKAYTGKELMENGINLTLLDSYQAEVIYFIDTTSEDASEIVKIPQSLDLNLVNKNSDLYININQDTLTEIANLKVLDGSKELLNENVCTNNEIIIKGLQKGNYKVVATAINKFGTISKTEQIELTDDSVYYTNDFNYSNINYKGTILIDNTYYLSGINVSLNNDVFNIDNVREVRINKIESTDLLNLSLILDKKDIGLLANIVVEAYDSNDEKTIIFNEDISYENNVLEINHGVLSSEKYYILRITNKANPIYYQTKLGYGRTGLYSQIINNDSYSFEFEVLVLQNGLNETFPRAGGFGAYKDDNCFSAIYIDAYYGNIVLYERTNGINSDTILKHKVNNDFNCYGVHKIKALKTINSITYYVDNEKIFERDTKIDSSKVAIITEDAKARFSNVKLLVNDSIQNMSWYKYNTQVRIKGKTIYSNRVNDGLWNLEMPKITIIERKEK